MMLMQAHSPQPFDMLFMDLANEEPSVSMLLHPSMSTAMSWPNETFGDLPPGGPTSTAMDIDGAPMQTITTAPPAAFPTRPLPLSTSGGGAQVKQQAPFVSPASTASPFTGAGVVFPHAAPASGVPPVAPWTTVASPSPVLATLPPQANQVSASSAAPPPAAQSTAPAAGGRAAQKDAKEKDKSEEHSEDDENDAGKSTTAGGRRRRLRKDPLRELQEQFKAKEAELRRLCNENSFLNRKAQVLQQVLNDRAKQEVMQASGANNIGGNSMRGPLLALPAVPLTSFGNSADMGAGNLIGFGSTTEKAANLIGIASATILAATPPSPASSGSTAHDVSNHSLGGTNGGVVVDGGVQDLKCEATMGGGSNVVGVMNRDAGSGTRVRMEEAAGTGADPSNSSMGGSSSRISSGELVTLQTIRGPGITGPGNTAMCLAPGGMLGVTVQQYCLRYKELLQALALRCMASEAQPDDPDVQEALAVALAEVRTYVHGVRVGSPLVYHEAQSINLDTGRPAEPREELWSSVARIAALTPQQCLDCKIAVELYHKRMVGVHEERVALMGQLGQALEATTRIQPETVELLTETILTEQMMGVETQLQLLQANLGREQKAMRLLAECSSSCMAPLQMAKLCVHSYPFTPRLVTIVERAALLAPEPGDS